MARPAGRGPKPGRRAPILLLRRWAVRAGRRVARSGGAAARAASAAACRRRGARGGRAGRGGRTAATRRTLLARARIVACDERKRGKHRCRHQPSLLHYSAPSRKSIHAARPCCGAIRHGANKSARAEVRCPIFHTECLGATRATGQEGRRRATARLRARGWRGRCRRRSARHPRGGTPQYARRERGRRGRPRTAASDV